MTVKDRRERQKEALREEILNAARELFAREGYESVSMRRIAEKIDYSPTTIYLYFQDKSELLFHVCEETFSKLVKTMEGLGLDRTDPVGNLKKAGRAYVEFGLRHPNHYKVTFMLPHQHEGIEVGEQAMGMRCFNNLRVMVEECVRQGQFRAMDVETTSQALWATMHGVTSLLIGHPTFPWVEKDKLIHHVVDAMVDGLKA